MKLKFLLLLVLLINSKAFYSQIACGFDDMLTVTNSDSTTKSIFESERARIRAKVAEIRQINNPTYRVSQNNYVIPVVFHLVGSNASSLTDAEVIAQLAVLNSAFSNSLGSTYSSADDMQIQFCLAQTLPSGATWSNTPAYNANLYTGATAGITRCTTSVANSLTANHNMASTGANSQQALLNIAYNGFDPARYLNIWVVESISALPSPYSNVIAGYGVFPNLVTTLDGIVMRLGAFGINTSFTNSQTSQGRILVHEAGHYLGLFHTFYYGCAGTTTATCNSAGDECCDTPPVSAPNQNTCAYLTSTPPNSCSESPTDDPDMFENHMDYQYDDAGNCRNTFTNDQEDRMHSIIQLYRQTLVSSANHVFTGLTNTSGCMANTISPGFTTDLPGASIQVCTGQSIGFTAAGGATTYTWTFPGGSPATVTGTNTPSGITYSVPGVYDVSLNITDASNNNFSSTSQIYVTACATYTGSKANWYFGQGSSISFTTGIAISKPFSSMSTMEASATVSNNSGNLLFYTNGWSVWNNTHATMPNGNGTLNGGPNTTFNQSTNQGVVIVPRPGNATNYYIYTMSDCAGFTSPINYGISQYEVDMTVSTGTVISTTPINPTENYANNESIISVPHNDGVNYWLIVKPRNNTATGLLNASTATYSASINQYLACYSVTSTGISNNPVLSLSSPYIPSTSYSAGNDGGSHMAISNDKKFFFIQDGLAQVGYLYYFDCANGHFNYITTITGLNSQGFCFSPNSRVLYGRSGSAIVQYDLDNLSVCSNTPPSKTISIGNPIGSLQIGPDNKIYIGGNFKTSIGVINFPDNVNTTNTSNECGLNIGSIPLIAGQTCRLDLPNDIIGQSGAVTEDFSFCIRNCGETCFTTLSSGDNFAWNFGDGNSISGTNTIIPTGTNGGTTSGNFEYPCHTYSATGTYTVTLSIDGHTAVTHTLSFTSPPTPTITGPSSVCPTNTTSPSYYYGPSGYTYNWTATNSTPSTGSADEFATTWTNFPATLTLTITDPANGCTASSSLAVNVYTAVGVAATSTLLCSGTSATLSASGPTSYSWSTGATTASISVTPSVSTIYTVTGTSGSCVTTKTISISVNASPTITVNSPTICAGSSTLLTASGANTYTWSTGANTNSISVSPGSSTVYTINGTTNNCVDSKTLNVTVTANPTVAISNATICSGTSIVLTATGASTYSWSTGAATASIAVTPTITTIYTVTGTTNGCTNTKTVSVTVNTTPTVAVSNKTICAGTPTVLTASGAATYSWNTGATTASISVTPTVTISYTVTGTTTGCSNTKTVTVTVIAQPILTITPTSTALCIGQSTTLTASGANTFTWNTGPTTASISVSPTVTITYTVTGTNTLTGCTNTKTVTVTVNPNPTVTAVASPTSICVGQTATLSAGGATTYSWNTSSTNTVITASPTVTTTYTVIGSYSTGCSSTKTVSVLVGPVNSSITATSTSVSVCGNGSATLTASGAINYTWMPGGISTATVAVSPSVATVYTLSGSSGAGCNTATTTLLVNPVISTLCCSAANSTINTSTYTAGNYTVSGTVIDMQGTITFTGNTSFNGYTFRMKPNTLLKVVGEFTLSLTNCKLFSCSELWDGISLQGSNSDVHGHLLLNNTTVEDMYNGIVVEGNNWSVTTPSTGPLISSTSSKLNKNYISIQFRNIDRMFYTPTSTYTNTPYPFTMITSTISSNTSTTSPGSSLKPSSTYTYAYNTWTGGATSSTNPPFVNFPRTFTGINLNNLNAMSSIIIGDSVTSGNTNTFDNMDFGITGTEVTSRIHNNYFKNITGSAKQTADGESFPASGPDEIGIAIAMTHTSTNTHTLTVGTYTRAPASGNPYPTGNVFEDCYKSVKALSCKNVIANGNQFNATITSTVPVYGADAYYYYKNQQAIWISALSDDANISYNYIQNFANGIYCSHTLSLTTAAISMIHNEIAAPSSTGYCKQAIQATQVGGTNLSSQKYLIQYNSIDQVYNGILAGGIPNGLQIRFNTVTLESMGKSLGTNTTSIRSAIKMSSANSGGGIIRGNTVTNNGAIPTTSLTAVNITGIYVVSSPSSKVECNTAYHLGRDFVFEGSSGASSWKANTMQDSYRGLEMRSSAVIGPQGATSGTPNLSANTWTTITQQTYVFTTNPNVTSKLYLLAGGNTEPTLNFGTNAYGTVAGGLMLSTGTSYTCSGGAAQRITNAGTDKTNSNGNNQKVATATDSLPEYTYLATADENEYEVFADEMMYMNKQWVFKLIEQDSINPANGTKLDDFYAANQNTAIDKLTEAQIAITNNDLNAANAANSSAQVKNSVEQKHQRANELTLKYMNDRYYSFTSDERQDLITMANECLVKGYYVVQARNLVDILMNQAIVYDDNCDDEANSSRKSTTEITKAMSYPSFNLFPNPNNGSMQLDYNLGNYGDAQFNLFDITGKLILSKDLSTTEGSLFINEQSLKNGVYFYSILVGANNIKTNKIVIIK